MSLSCEQFAEMLEQPVDDRRLPVAGSLLSHAAECSATRCQALWREHQAIEQAIAEWKQSTPVVTLAARVLSELATLPSESIQPAKVMTVPIDSTRSADWNSRGASRRTGWAVLTGMLALLVLVIGLWQGKWSPGTPVPNESIATETPQTPGTPEPETGIVRTVQESDDSTEEIQSPVGARYVLAAQSATEFMTDAAFLFVAGKPENPMDEPNRAEKWVEGLGEKFEPMREDLGRTLTSWLGPTTAM